MSETTDRKPFDLFELGVAVLMGMAALGTAMAGYQSSLWSGKSMDAYSESATLSAKAGTEQTTAIVALAHDLSVDIQGKRLILEAADARDPVDVARSYGIASYLYTHQINQTAYEALGLPPDLYMNAERIQIPTEKLVTVLDIDLTDDKYVEATYASAVEQFNRADSAFTQAREANDTGDQFGIATVIFAIGLFFGGISLVLRTNIRWVVLVLAALTSTGAGAYLLMLPWA